MFLLLLMGLGAAGVKAQVRIGGNTAPSAVAVLDLNTTDATNNGTKGLALPRVALTSDTMKLTTGVNNIYGMIAYNTNASLGGAGIYFWNGTHWVRANLPTTGPADSGKFLMSNGNGGFWVGFFAGTVTQHGTGWLKSTPSPVTWSLILDSAIMLHLENNATTVIDVPGLSPLDMCIQISGAADVDLFTVPNQINVRPITYTTTDMPYRIRCFRTSI